MYNSLGWNREDVVRIPVSSLVMIFFLHVLIQQNLKECHCDCLLQVSSASVIVRDSKGRPIDSQLLPVLNFSLAIRKLHTKAYLGTSPDESPSFWLVFPVSVPPLGFTSYIISSALKSGNLKASEIQASYQFNSKINW